MLGKCQGYLGLPVRDVFLDTEVDGPASPCMETAWIPNTDELERLNAGASVVLRIMGTAHPPVLVEVGEVPA